MTSHPSFLPVPFVLSRPPAPVVACLGLETLEEGEASSVASEGSPARTPPTKTLLAQPAGDLDPQLHQVSEKSSPRPLVPDAIVILMVFSKLWGQI